MGEKNLGSGFWNNDDDDEGDDDYGGDDGGDDDGGDDDGDDHEVVTMMVMVMVKMCRHCANSEAECNGTTIETI